MIQEGLKYLAAGMNPMDLKRGIDLAVGSVVHELKTIAQPSTNSQEIAYVAAISANNDRSIDELITRARHKVGREGAVTIEGGSGLVSELEVVEGMQFDRGYLSPYFVNNAEKQAAVLKNAAIVLCDQKLSTVNDEPLPLLEAIAKSGALMRSPRWSSTACAVSFKTYAVKAPDSAIAARPCCRTSRRAAVEEGIVPRWRGAAARPQGAGCRAPNLDQKSGIKINRRALEEPLRRIVDNAADEPSIVLHRIGESTRQRSRAWRCRTLQRSRVWC